MITLTQLRAKLSHPSAPGVHPVRDWFILMSVSLLVLLLSLAWNTWFFLRTLEGDLIYESNTSAPNASSLKTVETLFDARAGEAARYHDAVFIDPSQ